MKFSNLLPNLFVSQTTMLEIFQLHHESYIESIPGWSIKSTRRKLAAYYWLKIVLRHFVTLVLFATAFAWFIGHQPGLLFFRALLPACVLVFLLLFVSIYWPLYQLEFLPQLDTCVEIYAGSKLEGIQACKKEQFSVLSLMLIQFVTMQLASLETPLINTATAHLFARQYGVSVKSIAPAMQLILRGEWNRKSVRKRTEIIADFETAKSYFLALSEPRAITLLEKMQQRVLR